MDLIGGGALGTEFDGFLLEGDVETIEDGRADAVTQGGNLSKTGATGAVDESERVTGGDAGVAHNESTRESGGLHEPRGGELDPGGIGCGPMRDRFGRCVGDGGNLGQVCGCDHWVLEEGAGGAGIGIAVGSGLIGCDEHALAGADLADGVVDGEGRRRDAGAEVALEVGVANFRGGAGFEAEGETGDEEAIPVVRVEAGGAVGEATVIAGELDEVTGVAIESAEVVQGLSDLLTVGADVLDGRGTGEAGDTGEGLHPDEAALDGGEDEVIPKKAGGGGEENGLPDACVGEAGGEGETKDQAGKAFVVHQEVGPSAKNGDRQTILAGKGESLEDVLFGVDFGDKAGGAADAHGGEGSERDVFLKFKGGHEVRVPQAAGSEGVDVGGTIRGWGGGQRPRDGEGACTQRSW